MTYIIIMEWMSSFLTPQLDLMEGDEVRVLERVNESWWWVQLRGVTGYVPANHLSQALSHDSDEEEDRWQDEEYFSSYETLVMY